MSGNILPWPVLQLKMRYESGRNVSDNITHRSRCQRWKRLFVSPTLDVKGFFQTKTHEKRPSHVAIKVQVKPTMGMKPNFRCCRSSARKTVATANAPSAVAASQTQPDHPHRDRHCLQPQGGNLAVLPWLHRGSWHPLYYGLCSWLWRRASGRWNAGRGRDCKYQDRCSTVIIFRPPPRRLPSEPSDEDEDAQKDSYRRSKSWYKRANNRQRRGDNAWSTGRLEQRIQEFSVFKILSNVWHTSARVTHTSIESKYQLYICKSE